MRCSLTLRHVFNVQQQSLLFVCVFAQNKSDSPSQVSLETQSVFDEDLQKKIQENERLHIQVCVCVCVCVCVRESVCVCVMQINHPAVLELFLTSFML